MTGSRLQRHGESWLAAPSLLAMLLLIVFAAAAPWLAPYDPDAQHRDAPFSPPTRVHLFAPGRWRPTQPFVDVVSPGDAAALAWQPSGAAAVASARAPIRLFAHEQVEGLGGVTLTRTHLFGVEAPARLFLLGSDRYGRDRFSRLLAGARLSLAGGLLAASLAAGLGLLLGGIAGAGNPLTDAAISRAAEISLAMPWLYLLLALRAALPLSLAPVQVLFGLAAIIGLAGWARPAMQVRAVVLGGRTRAYVEAARGAGASEWFVLRRHLLPQALLVVCTQAATLAPQFTLAEMTLSFFGLGVNEPLASWGTLLADVSRDHLLEPSWYALSPLLAVILVFIVYQRAADAVIERLSEVTA